MVTPDLSYVYRKGEGDKKSVKITQGMSKEEKKKDKDKDKDIKIDLHYGEKNNNNNNNASWLRAGQQTEGSVIPPIDSNKSTIILSGRDTKQQHKSQREQKKNKHLHEHGTHRQFSQHRQFSHSGKLTRGIILKKVKMYAPSPTMSPTMSLPSRAWDTKARQARPQSAPPYPEGPGTPRRQVSSSPASDSTKFHRGGQGGRDGRRDGGTEGRREGGREGGWGRRFKQSTNTYTAHHLQKQTNKKK